MLYDYSPSGIECEEFADGYIETWEWLAHRDPTVEEEELLHREAREFLDSEHGARLIQAAIWRYNKPRGPHYRGSSYGWRSAGSDFYLTRERHGAGYWDRGLGLVGDALTAWAKSYGSSDVFLPYVED